MIHHIFIPQLMAVLFIGGSIVGYFILKKNKDVDRFGRAVGPIFIGIGTAILLNFALYILFNGIGWLDEDYKKDSHVFVPPVMVIYFIGGTIYGYFKIRKDPSINLHK